MHHHGHAESQLLGRDKNLTGNLKKDVKHSSQPNLLTDKEAPDWTPTRSKLFNPRGSDHDSSSDDVDSSVHFVEPEID